MPRLSMSEYTTYRWSFEEDVTHYRAAGLTAIGVCRRKLSDFGEEKGAELLQELKLAVSNLYWAGGFTGSEGRSYRESIEDAREAIQLAGRLRAKALVLYTGARAGHTQNHARRLIVDALKELAAVADRENVDLAIEPMHAGCAGDCTFLTSIADALHILTLVDHPRVRMVLDTYHVGCEENLVARLPDLVEHIAVVHLADRKADPDCNHNRCRLGEGRLPLREIVAALQTAGYDGDYDVELMGEEIETSNYEELIQHSQAAFQKLLAS